MDYRLFSTRVQGPISRKSTKKPNRKEFSLILFVRLESIFPPVLSNSRLQTLLWVFSVARLHCGFTDASCCFPADCRATTDFLHLISPLLGFIVLWFSEKLLNMNPELDVGVQRPQKTEEMILQRKHHNAASWNI